LAFVQVNSIHRKSSRSLEPSTNAWITVKMVTTRATDRFFKNHSTNGTL